MLRTKITELGRLNFLDDGGLVCSVTLNKPPNVLILRPQQQSEPNKPLIAYGLEFWEASTIAEASRHWAYWASGKREVRQLRMQTGRSQFDGPESYCFEVMPQAYYWPGVGTIPNLPDEFINARIGARIPLDSKVLEAKQAEWCQACATYQSNLHTNKSYRQAAREYFERQSREPQLVPRLLLRGGSTEG